MSVNRRQHWVPQAYLRAFADEGRLRVYARIPGKQGARQFETSTINIANERDLYTITTESGHDHSFDDELRREIENRIPQTFAALASGKPLKNEEWLSIVRHAAVQDMRGPTVIHGLAETISQVQEQVRYLYRQHVPGICEDEIDQRLREKWGETQLTGEHVLNPKNLALSVLQSTLNFTGQFAGMCGCIVESAAHDFVASDRPVVFHDPQILKPHPFYGINRSAPTVEVTFPLTRRYAFIMSRIPMVRYAFANSVGVSMINSRTAFGAASHVYAFPECDARLRRRQRNDIFRQFGLLSLAPLLFPDQSGLGIDPTMNALLRETRIRTRILADAFSNRLLISKSA